MVHTVAISCPCSRQPFVPSLDSPLLTAQGTVWLLRSQEV
jgi:hypothetical protein